MAIFSPSLFGGDLLDICGSVSLAVKAGADILHIDVMDGHFAPDFGFNAKTVREAGEFSDMPADIHLMVYEPEMFIEVFAERQVNCMYFHFEATDKAAAVLNYIKSMGLRAGIALSPETQPEDVRNLLPLCDEVLVMTVKPGRGGEKPSEACIFKIKRLRELAKKMNRQLLISVDGGIDLRLSKICVQYGAGKIVAGTSFYNAANPKEFCRSIKSL